MKNKFSYPRFTWSFHPGTLVVLCYFISLANCATTPSTSAGKSPNPCASTAVLRQTEPQKSDVHPIGTCKEQDRAEVKGKANDQKANDQDDKILH